jgi:hypothetical protein
MDIVDVIRGLAKTNKYQTLYCFAKEGSLTLFKNQFDYTNIQVIFLNYLNYYFNLYTDIAMGDIDDKVLEDFLYEDSWIYYKRKKREEENLKNKKESRKVKTPTNKKVIEKEQLDRISWNFNKGKKR